MTEHPASDATPTAPPPLGGWSRATGLAALFALSGLAGWACERLGTPLPWMIGPLVATAAIFMGPAPRIAVPTALRPVGQVVVATQVGLAFSPAALSMLFDLAPVIVGAALATGASILAVAWLMSRATGQPMAQAFLSAVPTSPVEAAGMAIAAGIAPMPVIFAQTLRLSAVVLIVPFALFAIEGWPDIERPPVSLDVGSPANLLVLVAIGAAGALVFRSLRVPNPNFLGPMAAAAVLAAGDVAPLPYPPVALALAQIILGTWLGGTFRRDFIRSALRLSIVSAASALLLLLLCALSALAIAALSGVAWRTVVLGSAPGGVVEMALTAQFLGQNVVLISTFHLVRIFLFMPNIPWIVRMIARHDQRKHTP